MAHDVVDACHHLILGNSKGETRIEDGEVGVTEVIEQFAVLRMAGDYRTAVHLRTSASHREHTAHRNPTASHRLPVFEVILPRVTIIPSTSGYGLTVVNSRATAYTKDEINILLARHVSSFQHLFYSRIRHHACYLYHLTAGFLQLSHHLVVDAVALDAATTIAEHHLLAIVFQFFTQHVFIVLKFVPNHGAKVRTLYYLGITYIG